MSLGTHDDESLLARFVLASREVCWDYDFFVAPIHRLGLTYAKIWDHVFSILRSRGIKWSFSYIFTYEKVSLRSQIAISAIPVGGFTAVKLGERQLFLSGRRPFVKVARGAQSRAEVLLIAPQAAL